ncbi:MAG: thioredoxin [Spirochaetes bacterium]|nr:thioredoxin [Spirochaetota bacterium]
MGGNTIEITDSNFEQEILKSDKPALVDFWAPWCGPCKMIGPVVEELSVDLADTLKVGKLNVDNSQETAVQFQVSSIPTLILFKDGQVAERIVGAMSKSALQSKLAPHLG